MGEDMRTKSLAVGSGKGGVGKTTTAVNLAIYYARQGYSTALVDTDPLSNAATLLDVEEEYRHGNLDPEASLDRYILPVLPNLDILFPGSKTGPEDSALLRTLLFDTFRDALEGAYDILIFDLPAGMDNDENLAFLSEVDHLIIVTNPQPTAHVAAGAYLKRALESAPDISVYFWHNRFNIGSESSLAYRDVIETYNRNMPSEEHLPDSLKKRVNPLAYVPEDPALDLLKGTPSSIMNIHRSLASVVSQLIDTRTELLTAGAPFNKGIRRLLALYISGKPEEKEDDFIRGFGDYVTTLLFSAFNISAAGKNPFTEEETLKIKRLYTQVKTDSQYRHLRRVEALLAKKIEQLEDETKLFSQGIHIVQDRDIDREIGLLLRSIERSAAFEALRPNAAILLFYFALYKLLQSPTIVGLLNDLIPFREGDRGEPVRDRRGQIAQLVHRSDEYRAQYLKMIKTVFPVVGKQIEAISKAFGLHHLLLRDSNKGRVRSDSYAKLLSTFIHDTLYSGLSVVVGFEYRSAAIAFQEGAESLGSKLLKNRSRKSA